MRDFDVISDKYKIYYLLIIIITRSYVVGYFAIFLEHNYLPTAIPSIQGSLLDSLLSHFLCRESSSITT